ncbi:MASE1 domain-containing protein [Dyella sp. C9]|uniref:MASE1 domain-containing protein n=1 Tax=Dyella sp. C9 TaxID=2202154 RepID=UPI00130053F5|nr:MASE1 domain-containing protein [Dyella sp. C9]
MEKATWHRHWGRHLFACMSYAIANAMLRGMPSSHLSLAAGLRMACLLLAPYRYWPALILGESLPLAGYAWSNADTFGWRWALASTMPPMAPLAILVALARRHGRLFRSDGRLDMPSLLGLMLAGALLMSLDDAIVLTSAQTPSIGMATAIDMRILLGFVLGDYLGALTVVPTVMAAYLWLLKPPSAPAWNSGLLRDCVIGGLVPLLVLLSLAFSSQGDGMQVFRIAMFLPVVWLTSRHGWPGAAIGGSLASLAVTFTSSVLQDPGVIQAQALIAFAASTLLLLGSRIAHQDHSTQADHSDTLRGFQLAQQGMYLEELRLRQAADALERIGRSILDNHQRLLERLRHALPPSEERTYKHQAAMAQHEMHRLANALYPRGWRERGVPATLRDGPFAQAIHASGASYQCELTGRGLSQLAPDVHMALYRLACEALVHVLSQGPMQHVQLQLRGGHTRGKRWVVMRLSGMHATAPAGPDLAPEPWRQAMSLLGASGLGIASIRDRAQIYGGQLHLREHEGTLVVTLLLHDSLRAAGGTPGGTAIR